MAERPFAHLLRQIRQLAGARQAETVSDAALLERFVGQRDEAAFELLVHRYGPLVLGLCRRLLRDVHAADDAFQATFLILARKAGAIRRPHFLGSWLYKVAGRAALAARTRDAQRRAHEWPAGDLHTAGPEDAEPAAWMATADAGTLDPATEAAWHELQPVLDDELQRLPEKYRAPLILCGLQGMTNDEAAQHLRWPTGTVKGRLSRARDLLRDRLARRGVALSAGLLTSALAQHAAAATPRLLINAVTRAALSFGTGQASATLAPSVAALAEGVLHGMANARWKAIAALLVTVCLAGTGIGVGVRWAAGTASTPTSTADAPPPYLSASLNGRRPFPNDNPWNQEIADAPVDPDSDTLIASIGQDKSLHANFGSRDGQSRGFPYVLVPGNQPRVPVHFVGDIDESDPGPYPIPPEVPLEHNGWDNQQSRVVVIDRDNWKLYELTGASRVGKGWRASYGAVFDLGSNALRREGWTSADGAGLPIFPGLVRFDEVSELGAIRHALRFTVAKTRRAFVHPARHFASLDKDPKRPPMGMRVRLKADYDISGFPPAARVILTALQRYGMFVAEHGDDWALSGAADARWNDADLQSLTHVHGQDFEVVQMGKLVTRVK